MNSRQRPPGQFGRQRRRAPATQRRALPQVYLSGKDAVVPEIYLPESERRSARFKWIVSTCFAGLAGLVAIAVTIYVAKDDGPGHTRLVDRFKQYGESALRQLDKKMKFAPGFRVAGGKSDRIIVSSRGLMTQHIIHDRVVQERGGRQFIAIKPYIRMVVSMATEKPENSAHIPSFNPFKLYANTSPVDGGKEGEGSTQDGNGAVSVKVIELVGGILPDEDGQELAASDVARLVEAAGEEYVTDARALETSANGTQLTTGKQRSEAPDATASATLSRMAIPARTTVIEKTLEQENDAGEVTEVRTVTVRPGDRLYDLLRKAGSETWQASAIIAAMNTLYKANDIRAGQKLRFLLTPSPKGNGQFEPVQVSLYDGDFHEVTVARSASGAYVASANPLAGTTPQAGKSGGKRYRERATAYTSLYHAGLVQGIPPEKIMKILRIHAYDTDFKRFVRRGDGFETFFDTVEDENGDLTPGELLFTAITIGGETRRFYRFRSPDGHVDYYDANGDSAKKFLMRKPVRSHDVRLTSGFGYRMHPVLKRRKMHTGVDWAARRGTPILAAGNGIVEYAGRKGGYGNYVRIRHANGYKTAYAHMHSIAPGIRKGGKVRQGQVIGSVGSTGRSTGNHLHFEVLVNNRHVNPMKIHVPRGRQLRGKLLLAFQKERARIDALMQRSPVKTRVATAQDLKRGGRGSGGLIGAGTLGVSAAGASTVHTR